MSIVTKPGRKGIGDTVVFYNGLPITFREFGEIFALLCKNEDRLYPRPKFRGSDFLISYLNDVRKAGGVTPWILMKYKLWRRWNNYQ